MRKVKIWNVGKIKTTQNFNYEQNAKDNRERERVCFLIFPECSSSTPQLGSGAERLNKPSGVPVTKHEYSTRLLWQPFVI